MNCSKQSRETQVSRILSMYDRLCNGHTLSKKSEADNFGVGEKTIQRDLESIRSFLELSKTNQYLEYDHKRKIYKIDSESEAFLLKEEILAITKILIESRAFPKEEMERLLDKITNLALPTDRDLIKKLILNEKYLYVDLQHKKSLFATLWEIAFAIHTKRTIKIHYKKELGKSERVRKLKPVGLIFSEYYFYLIAFQVDFELDYPTVYRIDRILSYQTMDEHFQLPYNERFQEGEFRKRIQFMQTGALTKIKFRFNGPSPQAVLDRLPTAHVLSENERGITFEAEVYGNGIKMWLLSQGEYVEVLEPKDLREEMKHVVKRMLNQYS
ncbi:YafY family protein [Rummeliibacillus sp. POC4]|uniref:helix-turn-helix transcriptional regulator n=1 Tax=Rummeliibacillus sp. POC4 TaxID=2305899 RepID=UPI000E666E29|nr:WYL domain-containing protein [Rummeliibacillus sp. POC4]RIJ63764.1 WYL domain-containing protein [Rummeliibacillus sp. POC4]